MNSKGETLKKMKLERGNSGKGGSTLYWGNYLKVPGFLYDSAKPLKSVGKSKSDSI
jgi:hypothetical protein